MKHSLAVLTFIFCLGISAAKFIRAPFCLIYPLALLFLILAFLSLKKQRGFYIFLFCLVFLSGALSLRNALALAGKLYRPFRGKVSGNNSYREYLYNKGIFLIMNAKVIKQVDTLNGDNSLVSRRLTFQLKEKLRKQSLSVYLILLPAF